MCPVATSKSDDTGALRASLSAAKEELTMLHAALDNVESGLLILDSDLRAVYSNPAVHKLFKNVTAQQIRQEKPLYVDLLKAAAQLPQRLPAAIQPAP